MAQTGTTFTLQSSAYQGRYLKLTCTSSQDIANNKTNISWKLESIGGSSGHYATIVRVNINGSEVYSIDKGYTYDAFPVTKGSTTGSTSVTMGSDGNKSITIYMDAAIYTSSTTRYSDTWTLNTVPRYPTISSFSVAKISGSSTSVSVSWAGSAPGGSINKVEYSKDNGSTWANANTTSSPFTISGLTSNTGYNFKIRVTSSASGLTATSGAYWQSTYQQPTANISTANISGYNGLSQIKVSWSSNMDIAKVEYSRDNGSTWYNAGDPNASSGNYTYTGLSENTSYNFKVRVTATTGSCVTTSGTSSLTTRKRVSGNLYVNGTKVGTSNGQTGIALKNGDTLEIKDITNNAGCGYKLFFENPDNQHQYLSAKTTGTGSISMTAEQIRQRLQYMTTVNSQGFNVGITTLNGSDQPALYYEFFGTLSVANSNPEFDENRWTYQDTNSTTVALTGSNQILVNGFSKLRVNIGTAASPQNYATISQYAVSGCTSGSSSTTGNIDCPNATNGGTIKVTAKDSRNNATETTKTATFKDYFVPTLTSITATRNNGGVGTQTSMTFNGTWWNANFGASNNTIAASYRYKSGSTWSSSRAITLTTSGNSYSFNTSQLYGDLNADGFTLGTTFTIEVTITDELNGGKSWTTVLNSGTPAIAISGNKVAIGKQYDTNKGGDLQVLGSVFLGNNNGFGQFQIHGNASSNIYWKEGNYGDQFRIIPSFGGEDDNNHLTVQASVGGSGTTPDLYNILYLTGKSGNMWLKGALTLGGAITRTLASSGTISTTNILSVTGSTDGLKLDYEATTADVGVAKLYTIDDGNARLELGNNVSGTYKRACYIENGKVLGNKSGNWNVDRDNALIRQSYGTGYSPVICQGTPNGTWTIGNLQGNESLYFNYVTDSDYSNNVNNSKRWTINNGGTFSGQAYKIESPWARDVATNANISHTYENSRVHLTIIPATSNMTSNKPTGDGIILHTSWDNSGQYCGQMYFSHTQGNPVQYRLCNNGTWTGWENIYKAKFLYSNASGTTGSITLSESAANFTFIEILYGDTKASAERQYCKAWQPNGKWYSLQIVSSTSTTEVQDTRLNTRTVGISGTSFWTGAQEVNYVPGGGRWNVNEITVYAVIGYR